MDGLALLSDQQPFLLLAGGVSLALMVVIRLILRRQRRRKKSPSPRAQVAASKAELDRAEPRRDTPLIDAPASVTRWHAEMHQVGRDIHAEIDSKIRLLQATVRSASREAERLEKVLAQARSERDWADLGSAVAQIEQLKGEIKAPLSPAHVPEAERPAT
jgi:predicted  nucleic acid-binding Zn-ribbon protein